MANSRINGKMLAKMLSKMKICEGGAGSAANTSLARSMQARHTESNTIGVILLTVMR